MRMFRSIEIDYDVHRLIEFERGHITESPNDVLRRLLGIDAETTDEDGATTLDPVDDDVVAARPAEQNDLQAAPHNA